MDVGTGLTGDQQPNVSTAAQIIREEISRVRMDCFCEFTPIGTWLADPVTASDFDVLVLPNEHAMAGDVTEELKRFSSRLRARLCAFIVSDSYFYPFMATLFAEVPFCVHLVVFPTIEHYRCSQFSRVCTLEAGAWLSSDTGRLSPSHLLASEETLKLWCMAELNTLPHGLRTNLTTKTRRVIEKWLIPLEQISNSFLRSLVLTLQQGGSRR